MLLYLILLAARDVDVADGLGLRIRSLAAAAGSVVVGLLAGGAIGLLGFGYLQLMRSTGWVELPPAPTGDRTALFLLAVLVAPVVEETLFRGLLLQGMCRSVSRLPAILWSAALFAAVHPVGSWPPVFVLGVTAAFVFQRTGFLPAAIAAHAAYNLIVVALQ